MADGQDQAQPQGELLGVPQNLFGQMLAHQLASSDTTGLTSVQPSLNPTSPAVRPVQPQQAQQRVGPAAPGTGPLIREQRLQNLSTSVQNLAGQISQQVQAKKQREYKQVTDQFTSLVKGINEAKSQVQQGQQLIQQAQNEQDPQRQQQMMQQGQQMVQQGQQALKQNTTNLNDIVSDSKKHKVITKAFGIDDKNAGSPERQAAIQSIQAQNQGMSQQGANVLSRLPQTQQLTPQAQQQSQAVQAGVMGRPATGGQVLSSQQKQQDNQVKMLINAANNAVKQGIAADRLQPTLERQGLTIEKDGGQPKRNPDGTLVIRQMTPDERKANPVLAAQDELTKAKTDLDRAQTDAKMNRDNPELQLKARQLGILAMDAQARMISANASAARAAIAMSPVAAAAGKKADDLETTYKNAQQYLKTPTPTNDTQLVFAYVRSAVAGAGRMTNTEIEQALKSGSFGTQLKNRYDRATTGKLDDEFRQELVNSIGIAATNARSTANKYKAGESDSSDAGADIDSQIMDAIGKSK